MTYLQQAAVLGAGLIIAVNDDASIKALGKGNDRPINPLEDRLVVLAALASVTAVIPFSQPTPLVTILAIEPEILVKGGDWPVEQIVGAEAVKARGGQVYSIPFKVEQSTSALLEKIRSG